MDMVTAEFAKALRRRKKNERILDSILTAKERISLLPAWSNRFPEGITAEARAANIDYFENIETLMGVSEKARGKPSTIPVWFMFPSKDHESKRIDHAFAKLKVATLGEAVDVPFEMIDEALKVVGIPVTFAFRTFYEVYHELDEETQPAPL